MIHFASGIALTVISLNNPADKRQCFNSPFEKPSTITLRTSWLETRAGQLHGLRHSTDRCQQAVQVSKVASGSCR